MVAFMLISFLFDWNGFIVPYFPPECKKFPVFFFSETLDKTIWMLYNKIRQSKTFYHVQIFNKGGSIDGSSGTETIFERNLLCHLYLTIFWDFAVLYRHIKAKELLEV